jgi:hypothetical protein
MTGDMLPRMHSIQMVLLVGVIAVSAVPTSAQNAIASPAPSTTPSIADSWHNLSVVTPHSHIHVAADHGGSTCYFIAVDDQNLTCGHRDGSEKGRRVFPRSDVKSVKLTRYGISTLGGLGIGAGAGAAIGFAAIRPHPDELLNFSGIARAACTAIGAVGGTAVGASTDMFRGPTIYRRADIE